MNVDEEYMSLALELAKKGRGAVNPNPMVGAVIVKDGIIIGRGYHEKYGQLHAERNAIASCKSSMEGATIYVTLEPCCHYGKTPPCTEAIIENKFKRVVVGAMDPNPLVGGKGVKILREHGIEVDTGILEDECLKLNEVFFHYITHKTPYVLMKYAMTMDGKIATYSGKSKWITGEGARHHVHEIRNAYSAIMVGVNTVIADDPLLTCRIEGGRNPQRIICDTNLRIPIESKIVRTSSEITTYIATASDNETKIQKLIESGCKIIKVSKDGEHIDLKQLMIELGKRNIDSVILEGGGTLNFSALNSGIVDKIQVYMAPKIFGGKEAKTAVEGCGVESPSQCFAYKCTNILDINEDILMEFEKKEG